RPPTGRVARSSHGQAGRADPQVPRQQLAGGGPHPRSLRRLGEHLGGGGPDGTAGLRMRDRPGLLRRGRSPPGAGHGGAGEEGAAMSAEPEDLPPIFTERSSQLLHRLAGRLSRPDRSLLAWSRAFRVEDGRPLDFDAFPFQQEIYEAFGDRGLPTVDVRKSAQCGISAAAVSLTLYAADVWTAHVLYVLPTEDLAERFSDTRVKPAIEGSPYLRSRVTGTDCKGLKRLGHANLHFVGSVAETYAISIPADLLLFDEYDRLTLKQVPKFEQR